MTMTALHLFTYHVTNYYSSIIASVHTLVNSYIIKFNPIIILTMSSDGSKVFPIYFL